MQNSKFKMMNKTTHAKNGGSENAPSSKEMRGRKGAVRASFGDGMYTIAGHRMAVVNSGSLNNKKCLPAEAGMRGSRPDVLVAEEELQHYVHAGFCFAHALLWQGELWEDAQLRKALGELEVFFKNTGDMDGAFVTLAKRCIIASILGGRPERMKLWAALVHPSGLASEPILGYSRQQERAFVAQNRMFTVGLPILVRYYLDYVKEPSADTIMAMKLELDGVEFGELMQVFFEVVNAAVVRV
jgi:hypothetical protein